MTQNSPTVVPSPTRALAWITDGHDGVRVVRVLAAAQASLDAGGAPVSIASLAAGVP